MATGLYVANQTTQTTYPNEDLKTIYNLEQETQGSVERITRNHQPKPTATINRYCSPVNGPKYKTHHTLNQKSQAIYQNKYLEMIYYLGQESSQSIACESRKYKMKRSYTLSIYGSTDTINSH